MSSPRVERRGRANGPQRFGSGLSLHPGLGLRGGRRRQCRDSEIDGLLKFRSAQLDPIRDRELHRRREFVVRNLQAPLGQLVEAAERDILDRETESRGFIRKPRPEVGQDDLRDRRVESIAIRIGIPVREISSGTALAQIPDKEGRNSLRNVSTTMRHRI